MKKINIKFILLFALSGIFVLFSGASSVHAAYQYESVAFYAQANPSSYAAEGISFYAFTSQADGTVPIYRYYNSSSGDHFYTTNSSAHSGYTSEGVAFYTYTTQADGTVPIYRYYNSSNGDHFYSTSDSTHPGYTSEGAVFYVFSSQSSGTSPVYRFYNPSTGDHLYTASENEKNTITLTPVFVYYNPSNGDHFYSASNSDHKGYSFEGISFYAYSSQVADSSPVYCYYNSSNGDHFYSTSNSTHSGYDSEGIVFYVYTNQDNGSSPVYLFYDPSKAKHFYTISEAEKNRLMSSTLGPDISVGLWAYTKSDLTGSGSFKIDANKKYKIEDKSGNVIAQVSGGTQTKVVYDSGGYFYVSGSISKTHVKTAVNFEAADGDNSSMIFNVHRPSSSYDNYRGKIKLQYTDSNNIWVVDTLPLEQYVWGAGEFTGTGPYEHTKVMATIYRTYGEWYIKYATKYNQYGFTIRSDSGSQIFYGYDHESSYPNVKKSAEDTRAVVVTYKGDIALTPYCSWSAGETRSFKDVWGSSDYPWCKARNDDWGDYNDSYFGHSDTKTQAELISEGNHMVGLIAQGSLHMADKGKSYSTILNYYYSGINLTTSY